MATIVEYTDRKTPQNRYPKKIVSPSRSGACCYSEMEEIGLPHETEQWEFRYKRSVASGYRSNNNSWLQPSPSIIVSGSSARA